MTRQSSASLKAGARTALSGKWVPATGVFITEFFCNFIMENLVVFAFPLEGGGWNLLLHLICLFIIGLISAILSAGSAYFFLNLCRGRQTQLSDLFFGFQNQPEHIAGWYLLLLGTALLCCLPPAFLLVQLLEHGGIIWLAAFLLASLCFLAVFIQIVLRCAMFPFLYAETPWKSPRELLLESSRMMRGQMGRFFFLQLSYLGLLLLCVFTMGIGLIWVMPYISTTNALFYLELSQDADTEI